MKAILLLFSAFVSAGLLFLSSCSSCTPERVNVTASFCGPGYAYNKTLKKCEMLAGADETLDGGFFPDIGAYIGDGGFTGDALLPDTHDGETDLDSSEDTDGNRDGGSGDTQTTSDIDYPDYSVTLLYPSTPVCCTVEIIVQPYPEDTFERAVLLVDSYSSTFPTAENAPWEIYFDTKLVSDGTYTFSLRAEWVGGIVEEYPVNLTIDNTYPKLIIVKPENDKSKFGINEDGTANLLFRVEDPHGLPFVSLEAASPYAKDAMTYNDEKPIDYSYEFVELKNFLTPSKHFPPGNKWSEAGVPINFTVNVADDVGNTSTYMFTLSLTKELWSYDVSNEDDAEILTAPQMVPGTDYFSIPQSILNGKATRITLIDPETGEKMCDMESMGEYVSLMSAGTYGLLLVTRDSTSKKGYAITSFTTECKRNWIYNDMKSESSYNSNLLIGSITSDSGFNLYFVQSTNNNDDTQLVSLNIAGGERWVVPHSGYYAASGTLRGNIIAYPVIRQNVTGNYFTYELRGYDISDGSDEFKISYSPSGTQLPFSYFFGPNDQFFIAPLNETYGTYESLRVFDSTLSSNLWNLGDSDKPDASYTFSVLLSYQPQSLLLTYYLPDANLMRTPVVLERRSVDTGSRAWQYTQSNKVFYTANLPNDPMYCAPADKSTSGAGKPTQLFAISSESGTSTWRREISGYPLATGGMIFIAERDDPFGSFNRGITRLDSTNGDELWSYDSPVGSSFSTGLYGQNNEMYLAEKFDGESSASKIVAVDKDTGSVLWSYPLNGAFSVGSDGTIYILVYDNTGRASKIEAIKP